APTMYDSCATTDGLHYFKVIAHTLIQTKFWESRPDSGYSVDNLAPSQPSGTKAEQSFNPEGLKLTWNANHEIDLSHYKIYRGDPDAMMMNSEIVLATTQDTTYFDDEWRWYHNYYYKISAVDYNGNESPPDSTGRGDVTGDETPPAPETTYLDQNFPNPFNPATTILFGLKEPAVVSLRVYDVSGRLVRTLVSGERAAGVYKEKWNGLDNKGRAVTSGIYFYRLHAGTFLKTKKMVLSR
ncbi:MAG: T9SS type A sorting domain-containing protein, partial [bacterium]